MLSCQKATELIEQKTETALNKRNKIQLLFHLKSCSGCSNYEKQSRIIEEALKSEGKRARPENTTPPHRLSPHKKEEIKKKLKEE